VTGQLPGPEEGHPDDIRPAEGRFDERLQMFPDPRADPVLNRMSGAALMSIYRRLGHCERPSRARRWEVAAELAAATVVTGLVGLIPLLASTSGKHRTLVIGVYLAALVLTAAVGVLCWLARGDVQAEKIDTIASIRDELGGLLRSYGMDVPPDEATP
jgi:hypothetical protein